MLSQGGMCKISVWHHYHACRALIETREDRLCRHAELGAIHVPRRPSKLSGALHVSSMYIGCITDLLVTEILCAHTSLRETSS